MAVEPEVFLWCNQAKENSVSLVRRVSLRWEMSLSDRRLSLERGTTRVQFYQSLNLTFTVAAGCHVRSCMCVWECMFKCGLVSLNTFPSQRTPFPLSLPEPVFFSKAEKTTSRAPRATFGSEWRTPTLRNRWIAQISGLKSCSSIMSRLRWEGSLERGLRISFLLAAMDLDCKAHWKLQRKMTWKCGV